jgi:hypothetical protein
MSLLMSGTRENHSPWRFSSIGAAHRRRPGALLPSVWWWIFVGGSRIGLHTPWHVRILDRKPAWSSNTEIRSRAIHPSMCAYRHTYLDAYTHSQVGQIQVAGAGAS